MVDSPGYYEEFIPNYGDTYHLLVIKDRGYTMAAPIEKDANLIRGVFEVRKSMGEWIKRQGRNGR